MAENAKQFFRRREGVVAAPADLESSGHEFFEFRAQQGEISLGIRDIDRRHTVEQRPGKKDVPRRTAGPAHCFEQCRIKSNDSVGSVVQYEVPEKHPSSTIGNRHWPSHPTTVHRKRTPRTNNPAQHALNRFIKPEKRIRFNKIV
jgi:hypothetical protein